MADDKHYVGGSFYRICDMTGFKIRAERTSKQWNNLIVREQSWEPRQPQDFVKGVRDEQAAPEPRPRQVNVFLGPLTTTLEANAAAGATQLSVQSSVRMEIGDNITLPLTDTVYSGNITSVPNSTTINIDPPLPQPAVSGTLLTDVSVIAQPNIDSSGSGGDD